MKKTYFQTLVLSLFLQSCFLVHGEAQLEPLPLEDEQYLKAGQVDTVDETDLAEYEVESRYKPYNPNDLWIKFKNNSYQIDSNAQKTLDKIIHGLKVDPLAKIVIRTHADSTGDYLYNRALSRKRAHSVKRYFVKNGIDPIRLHLDWVGEAEVGGVIKGKLRDARRAEFFLHYDLQR